MLQQESNQVESLGRPVLQVVVSQILHEEVAKPKQEWSLSWKNNLEWRLSTRMAWSLVPQKV